MAVTMKEMASQLGISQPTVSEILSGRGDRYRKVTRERVKKHAIEMGYRPNLLARGLVKGKTHTIGFLTGSPTLEIVSTMETTLDDSARETGYGVYIAHTGGELELTVKRANEFVDRSVDGLIIRGSFPSIPAEELEAKLNFPVPTVLLSIGAPKPFPCRQVSEDGAIGISQAVNHLYELGHRGIYMFRGYWKGWGNSLRFEGFRKAVSEHGFEDSERRIYEVCSGYSKKIDGHAAFDIEEIYSNTKSFLQGHPDCTAILCSSSAMSLAVLSVLVNLGKRVPEDISLAGFGSNLATLYSLPPLSIVNEPAGELIQAAFDMLMDEIDKKDDKPRTKIIPAKYIPRQSIGPVRRRATGNRE